MNPPSPISIMMFKDVFTLDYRGIDIIKNVFTLDYEGINMREGLLRKSGVPFLAFA